MTPKDAGHFIESDPLNSRLAEIAQKNGREPGRALRVDD
jgi:hypothetical protein